MTLTTHELCERLNIDPISIRNWRRRFTDDPQPVKMSGRHMQWSNKSVAEWKRFMKSHGLTGRKA